MMKKSSSRWMRWSYLALIPMLVVMMYACNSPKKSKTAVDVPEEVAAVQEAVPFAEIEVKPTFNGCDVNEFSKWVNTQLNYPDQAKADGIQGRVAVQFTIGADGVVGDVKVLRGVREDLDAEVVRVISDSPNWEPGRNADGKAVPVTFTFPVFFKLK